MLLTPLLLILLSLTISSLLTPLVRFLALRWNLIDKPDQRKVHTKPIPRLGGIAVAFGYFGAFLAVAAFVSNAMPGESSQFDAIRAIAPAAALIFLIGLADDIFGLEPWHKFSVQILAGILVAAGGIRIHTVAGLAVHPLLGGALTVFWLVACTNAVNLIDGLDGLAAGIALLGSTTILVASLASGNVELTIAIAPLAGALIGFLFFNFNPASIFLGDSGSLVLGFLLGSFSLLWSADAASVGGTVAPLLTLAVPLLDTTLAMARRFVCGKPLFRPDRSHIHHRLLARGCSHRGAVLWLYLAAAAAGALSLSLSWASARWEAAVVTVFVAATLYGVRQLRYPEFGAAREVIGGDFVRREIGARLAVRDLESGLTQAQTPAECWSAIERTAQGLGLQAGRLHLANEVFGSVRVASIPHPWAMRISISETDWLEVFHETSLNAYPAALVLFAQTMQGVLADKSFENAFTPVLTTEYETSLYEIAGSAVQ